MKITQEVLVLDVVAREALNAMRTSFPFNTYLLGKSTLYDQGQLIQIPTRFPQRQNTTDCVTVKTVLSWRIREDM